MRPSGRAQSDMRAVQLQRHFTRHAEGSVLAEFGDTRVLCTASVEGRVPPFLKGTGRGLGDRRVRHAPARHQRAGAARGYTRAPRGRTLEIQRSDRSFAARRRGSRGARRANDLSGLRRAAG